MLESAVIRRIFSLWKCKEGATNIFWHPKNKKRLINQSCRGGETGRRARLKIWFQQWSVGSSPTLGTIVHLESMTYNMEVSITPKLAPITISFVPASSEVFQTISPTYH